MNVLKVFAVLNIILSMSNLFAKDYKIGILQTASHPSLDAAKQGFEKRLQEKFAPKKVVFVDKNGEGQISQLQTIAKSFKANADMDAMYVIATPALQVMMKEEKTRPIVFTAVTSPASVGVDSVKTPNVMGITDKIDAAFQIELIKKISPKVNKVGVLFNPSEQNSVAMVKDIKEGFAKNGLTLIEFGIHNTTDITMTLNSAGKTGLNSQAKKVDLVLVPADNTAASAMSLIAKKSKQLSLPLMTSYITGLDDGIFLETGVNYTKCGEEAAERLFQVLEQNKKVGDIGVRSSDGLKTVVHMKAMKELKLELPKEVLLATEKI